MEPGVDRPRWPTIGVIVGAVLLTGPVFGLLGTVLGMGKSFVEIESSQGQVSPERLGPHVDFALWTSLGGWLAGFLGAALLVVSLLATARSRANRHVQDASGEV